MKPWFSTVCCFSKADCCQRRFTIPEVFDGVVQVLNRDLMGATGVLSAMVILL